MSKRCQAAEPDTWPIRGGAEPGVELKQGEELSQGAVCKKKPKTGRL